MSLRILARTALAAAALAGSLQLAAAQEVSLWARARTEGYVRPLVEAWNAAKSPKIALNVIPNEQFLPKLGAAIAGGAAPDIMSIDLIYVPALAREDQLTDLTAQIAALPVKDKLSQSHIRLATFQNKQYALPFSAEGSFLVYNKALFKRAGLDPDKPPQSFADIRDAAAKITALGDDHYGFYFPGGCAGCNVFTVLPLIWAAGGDVLTPDGAKPTLDSAALRQALGLYRDLWASKSVPQAARADGGQNWTAAFAGGKIGMFSTGAFAIAALKKLNPNLDFGVTYLPGAEPGKWSSFAGGDSIGIPRGSRNVAAAWEFIRWTTSDEVQIELLAKNGSIPVRSDLADNKYSQQDTRLVTAAKAMASGRTPYSFAYNELFNSPQGPFLQMLQRAVFEGDVDGAVTQAQKRFEQLIAEAK